MQRPRPPGYVPPPPPPGYVPPPLVPPRTPSPAAGQLDELRALLQGGPALQPGQKSLRSGGVWLYFERHGAAVTVREAHADADVGLVPTLEVASAARTTQVRFLPGMQWDNIVTVRKRSHLRLLGSVLRAFFDVDLAQDAPLKRLRFVDITLDEHAREVERSVKLEEVTSLLSTADVRSNPAVLDVMSASHQARANELQAIRSQNEATRVSNLLEQPQNWYWANFTAKNGGIRMGIQVHQPPSHADDDAPRQLGTAVLQYNTKNHVRRTFLIHRYVNSTYDIVVDIEKELWDSMTEPEKKEHKKLFTEVLLYLKWARMTTPSKVAIAVTNGYMGDRIEVVPLRPAAGTVGGRARARPTSKQMQRSSARPARPRPRPPGKK